MNIVNILGSPRKNGTSARIARAFAETAATYGATVTDYALNTMQYRGCQGCEGCHTRADRCVLLDEATPALDHLYQADIVVFSAPIYFGDTCGQFKSFFDRMWSLIRTDAPEDEAGTRLPPNKVAVLVLTHVQAAGAHNDVVGRYVRNLELYGFEVRPLVAGGLRLQPNTDIDAHLRAAATLARELVRAG
ncbi:flavodoxin family protein [Desulfobulbus sp.]|uniref:flavodoxin family protein n=1 Tax=Desulfobulbus sp. TaxID=895 RepID=UPI00286ED94B|nr:flavodoxin family protein [Desulfobulbus sp.]